MTSGLPDSPNPIHSREPIVTVVTIAFNSAATIDDTLRSVAAQDYPKIEHIVIDGGSSDATVAIATAYPHVACVISEPDRGLYDAMNKGIRLATGDIVGLLNSDDFYARPDAITSVVAAFRAGVDATIGDIDFVDPDDLQRVTRRYRSSDWSPGDFRLGIMPAHPAFFVRADAYTRFGLFKDDYWIAADFDLMCRMLGHGRMTYTHVPDVLVHMRRGGRSNGGVRSAITLNREVARAAAENDIDLAPFWVIRKYVHKLGQLRRGPRWSSRGAD